MLENEKMLNEKFCFYKEKGSILQISKSEYFENSVNIWVRPLLGGGGVEPPAAKKVQVFSQIIKMLGIF